MNLKKKKNKKQLAQEKRTKGLLSQKTHKSSSGYLGYLSTPSGGEVEVEGRLEELRMTGVQSKCRQL